MITPESLVKEKRVLNQNLVLYNKGPEESLIMIHVKRQEYPEVIDKACHEGFTTSHPPVLYKEAVLGKLVSMDSKRMGETVTPH